MEIFKEIGPMRAFIRSARIQQRSIGFVPTMGALHEGHRALVRASKQQNDLTVCSIFVNPTQFNNANDLAKYPRTVSEDIVQLQSEKCDVLFLPEVATMYETPHQLTFSLGELDQLWEGKFRPGHFSGVALVVSKLFNIVQPSRAYFGQKDFQQFLVIQRLVNELLFDLELICFPTVREPDGLALSSRNKRLSAQGRVDALALYKSLVAARQSLQRGEPWASVKKAIETNLENSGNVRLEYFALASRENLFPIEHVSSENLSKAVLLIAAYVEDVRLIDNLFVEADS